MLSCAHLSIGPQEPLLLSSDTAIEMLKMPLVTVSIQIGQ